MKIKVMSVTNKSILYSIVLLSLVLTISIFTMSPMAQDISYHNFADSRKIYNISNFWNVVSNAPFIFVAIYAIYRIYITNSLVIMKSIKVVYVLFFVGIFLVSFGSSYYHLNPNNETLLWDRLPMTIAFMSLFTIVISEFISERFSKHIFMILLLFGMGSVLYWFVGEMNQSGDLRWYILVQFLPMILMPIIFIFFNSKYTLVRGYWLLLLSYFIAKIFEYFDVEIYELLGFISGHSLKHMMSAFGIYILMHSFEKRYEKYNLK